MRSSGSSASTASNRSTSRSKCSGDPGEQVPLVADVRVQRGRGHAEPCATAATSRWSAPSCSRAGPPGGGQHPRSRERVRSRPDGGLLTDRPTSCGRPGRCGPGRRRAGRSRTAPHTSAPSGPGRRSAAPVAGRGRHPARVQEERRAEPGSGRSGDRAPSHRGGVEDLELLVAVLVDHDHDVAVVGSGAPGARHELGRAGEGAAVVGPPIGDRHGVEVEAHERRGDRLGRQVLGVDQAVEVGVAVEAPPLVGKQLGVEPDPREPQAAAAGACRGAGAVAGGEHAAPELVVPGELRVDDGAVGRVDAVAADDAGLHAESDQSLVLAALVLDHQVGEGDVFEVDGEQAVGLVLVDADVAGRHRDRHRRDRYRPTGWGPGDVGLGDDAQVGDVVVGGGPLPDADDLGADGEREVGEHQVVAGGLDVVDRLELGEPRERPAVHRSVERPPGQERGRSARAGDRCRVHEPEDTVIVVGGRVGGDGDHRFE